MHVQLKFLGAYAVLLDGTPVSYFRSDKVRALLAYLALEPRAHSRRALRTLLWPDAPAKSSARNLRTVIYYLRQNLDAVIPGAADQLVEVDHNQLRLRLEVEVDVFEFQALLAQISAHDHADERHCDRCLGNLEAAVQLYRGELFPNLTFIARPFDEWLLWQRTLLEDQAIETMARLAAAYRANDRPGEAIGLLRELLQIDPFREASHRSMMQLEAELGNQERALAQYNHLHDLFQRELGIGPSAKTIMLAKEIQEANASQIAAITPRQSTGSLETDEAIAQSPHTVAAPSVGTIIERSSMKQADEARKQWYFGSAPLGSPFYGRQADRATLQQWLVHDGCQLISILGMGGIGKSTLAAHVMEQIAPQYDLVFWRSLVNAPQLLELLSSVLNFLEDDSLAELPSDLDTLMQMLLTSLEKQRLLLVLDNLESILKPIGLGAYQPGYESYDQLFQLIASAPHGSQVLVTSREHPPNFSRWEGDTPRVRSLYLDGLDYAAGSELLRGRGIVGSTAQQRQVIEQYSGNPLALKLVADTVDTLLGGDVDALLDEAAPVFGDIRLILDQQVNRLSELETDILFWLAIARQPLSFPALRSRLLYQPSGHKLVEAIRNLAGCSLLEPGETDLSLQNVILEYLTNRIVDGVAQEFLQGRLGMIHRHALLNAQASDYVQRSQVRLIWQPILAQIKPVLGDQGIVDAARRLLDELRSGSTNLHSYAGGNLLNLLLQSGVDIAGLDFSYLAVWQANASDHLLLDIDFTGADLNGSVFTNSVGFIYAIAIDPSGQLLAVGASEGTIHLLHSDTMSLMANLEGHSQPIWSLAFSRDGQILASGSADGTVRLWDVESRQVITVLHGHTDGVHSLSFGPHSGITSESQVLATGCGDHKIRIWNVDSAELLHVIHAHQDKVQAVAFHPEKKQLASGSRDGTVRLWFLTDPQADGETPGRFVTRRSQWVNALAWSPDGRTLSIGDGDGTITLLNERSLDQTTRTRTVTTDSAADPHWTEREMTGHQGDVQALAFSPRGEWLASGGIDSTVRIWEVKSATEFRNLKGHKGAVRAVAFTPDNKFLVSGSWDHSVRQWNVENWRAQDAGETAFLFQGQSAWHFTANFSPDGATLATAGSDRTICLWRVQSGQLLHTLRGHTDWVWRTVYSPDGTILVSVGFDKTIKLWNVRTNTPIATLTGHTGGVQAVAFSPDGNTLATASVDHNVLLWDSKTGDLIQSIGRHEGWALSVAFSPDGRRLVSAGTDQLIVIWDLVTGKSERILVGHTDAVQHVTFSPDGRLVASASWDRTVRLWDIASGKNRAVLTGHTQMAQGVAFSPDGRTLASSSYDETVRLWDVATGVQRQVLTGHTHYVFLVDFSPDGRTLASSSADGTVRIWDAVRGETLHTLRTPGPYQGMGISGVTGITAAQRSSLKALGAID